MQNKFLNFLGIAKKSRNLVEGYNACEDEIKRRKIRLCILSAECSDNTKSKFQKYCNDHNIPIIDGISSDELGPSIGRAEINVLAVKDELMSKNLIKLWKENYKM
ncbi:MAG: ribosomal L7Ae/L30e/S12e/Gadd45 family protein [Clostridium sp.]|uniref:ribosomal L7Ae/L30e/S12e/Gadd45 family protein n=1 Tax=Clostridium sp. TaxID=1506 RepID=UPI003048F722